MSDSVFNWKCISKINLRQESLKIKDLDSCPKKCHIYRDCQSCLKSKGAEGGSRECHWATHLNQCLSPSYQPFYCAGGVCGLVIQPKQIEQCPSPCYNFTQCDECLRHAHCGWCGNDDENGKGLCTEGSLNSPLNSNCEQLFSKVYDTDKKSQSIKWYFFQCPPENECENGHHRCDSLSEHCRDLFSGYECVCGPGYRAAGGSCVPVCTQGCVRGACVRPNVCNCDFGYVGANCSIQCQCNGHANCEGPDKLNQCLECHNNTMVSDNRF